MESDSLPEEIISDILLRLPAKSLIRCTAVCKPWKSMIKCSKFIHDHLSRTIKANDQQGTHLLLHHGRYIPAPSVRNNLEEAYKEELYSLHYDTNAFDECCKLDFPVDRMVSKLNDRFCVAGVCNGVICLADDMFVKCFNYILWNPSIRRVVMLPWPAVTVLSHGPFDDTIGFGFDALTGDYKVVRLVTLGTGRHEPTLAEVYSVATGSWRSSLGSIASCCELSARVSYVFFNGAIHWAVRRWTDHSSFILTFDVGSEEFGEIMMPESVKLYLGARVSVTGDGKSLALFTGCKTQYDGFDYYIDIWVIKEYGVQESWTKLMTLGPKMELPKPFSFRKSGEVFVLQIHGSDGDENVLASLDLASRKTNKPESCQNKYSNSVHSYEESLVLLDVVTAVSY